MENKENTNALLVRVQTDATILQTRKSQLKLNIRYCKRYMCLSSKCACVLVKMCNRTQTTLAMLPKPVSVHHPLERVVKHGVNFQ